MNSSEAYRLFSRILAAAMTKSDPARALREAAENEDLPDTLRAALANVYEDGVEISGLLIAKLRFERLLQGSSVAGDLFENDPQGFAAIFDRYHTTIAPTACFPQEEARLFEEWLNKDAAGPDSLPGASTASDEENL